MSTFGSLYIYCECTFVVCRFILSAFIVNNSSWAHSSITLSTCTWQQPLKRVLSCQKRQLLVYHGDACLFVWKPVRKTSSHASWQRTLVYICLSSLSCSELLLAWREEQGNKHRRNSPGNARPQSSQLAEPLWTDPGLRKGIKARELTFLYFFFFFLEEQAGNDLSNIPP